MSLTPAFLDELRARTLLSALVGRTTKLQRAGREWKSCCPFHDEKTASFYVNDDKGFYHCLAGDTMVVTAGGRRPIRELAGEVATVLTRGGRLVEARFAAYGEQRLWRVELGRNGVRKTLHATDGHRWLVHDRKTERLTRELRRGHALESVRPPRCADWRLDPVGVRHGIVFGDGSMGKQVYGHVHLHGEKDADLLVWFPDQRQQLKTRAGGRTYVRIYGGRAFAGMKDLPARDASPAYLLGFLAGYFAADGHVAKDGTVILNSARRENLEAVRDIALSLGITTYGVTSQLRSGFGASPSFIHRIHFLGSSLSDDFFLCAEARKRFSASSKRFERLRWVVREVAPTNRVEPVYCAEVPGDHAFALDDNILTGNCFGCSAHGDAIRWLTDSRGLPFMDAVKELAAAAGMDMPDPDPRAAERAERHNTLHGVMAAADAWFGEQLGGIDGAGARAYLARRGVSAETAKAFGLGFAPDSRGKLKAALAKFGDALLVESGLLIAVDDKESYDRFRGRLMIPIRDPRGRTIAFGGRILGDGEPKYLNSPDTPLFDKGRTLWNLDRAAGPARKAARLLVVEGYMDAIALAGAGIDDVVAPMGTALTEAQLERLWRIVDVPVLCFDGDAAGQKAAMRAALRALPALAPGRSLAFATLPPGQDPDDLVKAGGRAAFEAVIETAVPLVDRLWQAEHDAAPLATPEARAGLKRRLGDHIAAIGDREVRRHYAEAMRARFDAAFFAPRAETPSRTRSPRARFAGPDPRSLPPGAEISGKHIGARGVDPIYERPIMAGLVRHPPVILACAETLAGLRFADAGLGRLKEVLVDAAYDADIVESAQLDAICEAAGLAALLDDLRATNRHKGIAFSFLQGNAPPERARRDLAMTIEAGAARPELAAALAAATARAMAGGNEETIAEQARLMRAQAAADQTLLSLMGYDDGI